MALGEEGSPGARPRLESWRGTSPSSSTPQTGAPCCAAPPTSPARCDCAPRTTPRTARLESNHIFMLAVQHSVYLCLATVNMTNLLFLAFNWIGAFNSSTTVERCYSSKEQQGEVEITANLRDSPCKIELSSLVPPNGLPRATFFFPNGEVSIKEKILDEGDRILSVNGLVKSHVLNGVCTAVYNDNAMNIKYRYKDDEISFVPSISLPSNTLSFAFKRQLTPLDKLSYWYNFDKNDWGAVYKHKANKHLKWKAGYESDNRLGWASLWVGDAGGSTKEVPFKAKVHLTLKVPQDNMQNSALVLHVKKRWDF